MKSGGNMVVEQYVPNERVKSYFRILSPRFPSWLNDYINTTPLLKQQYISMTCGTIYTDLFDSNFFYSSLDHSVAVALIVWHFTKDKKQTLAGLFHDIATPAFKHCVDFLNGDYLKQESTEDLTTEIIKDSPEIMRLLKRDGIKLKEVDNYHLYPIADNETPKLSSDRLEYSFSNALFTYHLWEEKEVKTIYDSITIQKNSDGEDELGFKNEQIRNIFTKQNNWIAIISIIFGLPMGFYLTDWLFKTAIEEHYDFGASITLKTYIISALGTFVVSYLVSKFLSRKVKNIDMVSSLKGNE